MKFGSKEKLLKERRRGLLWKPSLWSFRRLLIKRQRREKHWKMSFRLLKMKKKILWKKELPRKPSFKRIETQLKLKPSGKRF